MPELELDPATEQMAAQGDAAPVADHLRAIDPSHAQFANRLHRLIACAPGLHLLRGWHQRAKVANVFADPTGLLWRPLGGGGEAGEDLDGQVALLVEHEAALSAFERLSGMSFNPNAVINSDDCAVRWIEVGFGQQRSLFGFMPAAIDAATLSAQDEEPPLSRTPHTAVVCVRACHAPLGDVEALAAGALVLLSPTLRTSITLVDAGREFEGSLDPGSGAFVPTRKEGADCMNDAKPNPAPGALMVALTIRLPEFAVPAAEVEALAEGGSITFMPLSEGLAAELLVAGQRIAAGEIVRLGDCFAFLVDTMCVAPPASRTGAEADAPATAGGPQ